MQLAEWLEIQDHVFTLKVTSIIIMVPFHWIRSKHVFLLVMGDLLPFGTDAEDSILRINSDEVSNSPINLNLTSPIVFYLEKRTSLYVRNSTMYI